MPKIVSVKTIQCELHQQKWWRRTVAKNLGEREENRKKRLQYCREKLTNTGRTWWFLVMRWPQLSNLMGKLKLGGKYQRKYSTCSFFKIRDFLSSFQHLVNILSYKIQILKTSKDKIIYDISLYNLGHSNNPFLLMHWSIFSWYSFCSYRETVLVKHSSVSISHEFCKNIMTSGPLVPNKFCPQRF